MLHDRHQLYRVVSLLHDPRYHVFGKFEVATNSQLLSSDSNVTFVDSEAFRFRWLGMFELVYLKEER